jgi:hypothetical protein
VALDEVAGNGQAQAGTDPAAGCLFIHLAKFLEDRHHGIQGAMPTPVSSMMI